MMTDGAEGTPDGVTDSQDSQGSINEIIEQLLEDHLICKGMLRDCSQPNLPRLIIPDSSITLGSFANDAAVCGSKIPNECEAQSGEISVKYEPHQVEATSPDSGYVPVHSNDSRRSNFDETTDGHSRYTCTPEAVIGPVSYDPIAMYEIPALPIVVNPARANLVGDHGFRISFAKRDFVPKSPSYTYSPALHKLFVKINSACSVQFTCEYPPPPGTIVRAMLLYQNAEDVHEAVCRCQNHFFSDGTNQDIAQHVMQVASHIQNTIYDSSKGRFCVSVPFEAPVPGVKEFAVQYKFVCYSTCIGGINRRPLVAVFTLETDQGHTLGRASVELKICSCPGRDRHNDEKRRKQQDMPNPVGVSMPVTLPKKRPMSGDAGRGFKFLKVKEEHFDILSKINNAFNLASMATEQQRSEYNQEEQRHRWTEDLAKFCRHSFPEDF